MALAATGTGLQNRMRAAFASSAARSTSTRRGFALSLGLGSLRPTARTSSAHFGLLSRIIGAVDTGTQPVADPLVQLPGPDPATLLVQTYAGDRRR